MHITAPVVILIMTVLPDATIMSFYCPGPAAFENQYSIYFYKEVRNE